MLATPCTATRAAQASSPLSLQGEEPVPNSRLFSIAARLCAVCDRVNPVLTVIDVTARSCRTQRRVGEINAFGFFPPKICWLGGPGDSYHSRQEDRPSSHIPARSQDSSSVY